MRKKPAGGYALDVSAVAGPIRSLKRNPWPIDAHYFNGTNSALCASGDWVAYADFTMEDGTDHLFPFAFSLTKSGADSLLYGWPGFGDLDSDELYLGTYKTGVIYYDPFDEIPKSNLSVWIASH